MKKSLVKNTLYFVKYKKEHFVLKCENIIQVRHYKSYPEKKKISKQMTRNKA
jgi:hypothetical protein